MNPRLAIVAILFLAIAPLSLRAELSEILKFLAAQSDVIAVVTIAESPTMWGGSAPIPAGKPVPYWTETTVRVNVLALIKGSLGDARPLITARIPTVAGTRENDDPSQTMAKTYGRDRKCILFLQDRRKNAQLGQATSNGESIHLVAFDPFFSCQSYDRAMEVTLRDDFAREKKSD